LLFVRYCLFNIFATNLQCWGPFLHPQPEDAPCCGDGDPTEGKRPLGRPRRRWVDYIRKDLGEVGWGDVDWIGLAKDRNKWIALVNSVLNLRVP
jgi:hypothetical protein